MSSAAIVIGTLRVKGKNICSQGFKSLPLFIGVGRFTILGGPRFRILGGPRGAKFPEASTSFRRHVPNRFLINQCQIITFLILKYDIIENSRTELRGIVLPVQVGGLLGGPGPLWPPLFLRLCY